MQTSADERFVVKGWLWAGVTLGCLIALSWVILHWNLDRFIAGRFYTPEKGWLLGKRQPWQWLYDFGTIPGIVLAVAALFAWAGCLMRARWHHLHRFFLVVVLTAVIGPGILINGILKPFWGRPRPRQVQEFGGQLAYRPFYHPGIPGEGKSFTCGHCSMGFLFFSLVAFRRKNAWIAVAGGATGAALGGLLGAARMLQGAHFLSDVLWSLGIVLMVIIVLYYFVLQVPKQRA